MWEGSSVWRKGTRTAGGREKGAGGFEESVSLEVAGLLLLLLLLLDLREALREVVLAMMLSDYVKLDA